MKEFFSKIFRAVKEFFSKLIWMVRYEWQKEEWIIFGAGCAVSGLIGFLIK